MNFLKKKRFYFIILLLLIASCNSNQNIIQIEGEAFSGVIFKKNFSHTYSDGETLKAIDFIAGNPKETWTPEYDDIMMLERNLAILNKDTLRFKNLENYKRQYIGFIDDMNHKNISIRLLNMDNIEDTLYILPIITNDTDSSVFSISYSLIDSSFSDLRFY